MKSLLARPHSANSPLPFPGENAYEPAAMTQFRLSIAIRIIGPAFRAQ
jgi:hypothetical protein